MTIYVTYFFRFYNTSMQWSMIFEQRVWVRSASFRKLQIWPFDSNSLFKNHHCMELYLGKVLKKRKKEVTYRHSRGARFAKYRSILHLRCFIPCLGYRMEEPDCCENWYVHFSIGFVYSLSFRFAKFSKTAECKVFFTQVNCRLYKRSDKSQAILFKSKTINLLIKRGAMRWKWTHLAFLICPFVLFSLRHKLLQTKKLSNTC